MTTLAEHIAEIKAKVYNNSPSACEQLDAIWAACKNLDRMNADSAYIQPLEDEVVHLIWNLHGCPEAEHPWPVPPPPPPEIEEDRRHRGR